MNFQSAFKLKLIYVFRINDEAHKGCLKVGETTFKGDASPLELQNNCKLLNQAAKERIAQYTSTAGISYDLLHTELTLTIRQGVFTAFNDGEVHKVLRRSGIKQKFFGTDKRANEWFVADLETVKRAIAAAKEGRDSLLPGEITADRNPIVFRPEQRAAIDQAKKKFKKGNQFLWNAKMRFGKTLSALQLVKEMDFRRTLILTHRPVVDKGWFEDFQKIFYDTDRFQYGSKNNGDTFATLERSGKHYVYFASMQDLRGSELVGGNFDKNNELFSTHWSLIIIDEAHEGTKTSLGEAVLNALCHKEHPTTSQRPVLGGTIAEPKVLRLSGTPFNLLDDFKEDEIYTWDYVMEQRAKQEWEQTHWGDPNPYACLPKLNIYTYDLSLELKRYQDEEHAFNFKEFFRVGQDDRFTHEADVDRFLSLLATSSKTSQYPYSTLEWRRNFRHSLWTVPGVREARALKEKLERHPVFSMFKIVNVAGDGVADSDYESNDALEMVEEAIGKNPDETWTITLSCGRLTTGVSVRAWTAVFMMSGSFSTSASSYMQTIFRVQTPAEFNGRMKTECFVFDFAPDRTLKVLAETAKISSRAGKATVEDKAILGEFLNFCPVISFHGSQMSSVDVPHMMQQLKRVYVERVVRNGFEDGYLYNDNMFQLSAGELQEFDDLKKIIGQTKSMPKSGDVDLNKQGFTNEEYERLEKAEKKKKKEELTEEEKALLEKKKEMKKNRDTAISILRGISIRMPMILYGAEITDEDAEITLDNFTNLIDAQSWEEFMPKGVSKQRFNAFKKYYDEDIFAAAGKRIREMARAADQMDIEERIERITSIFTSFRNPDKETVLTPWRVVNMHLGDTLGGYTFTAPPQPSPQGREFIPMGGEPVFIDHGEVTREVFAPDSKVLEINSKSGLYALYVAYSIYRCKLAELYPDGTPSLGRAGEGLQDIWDSVLRENIFIVCKTPMAKSITRRTLAGFRPGVKVNTRHFEDLINTITNKREQFIKRITDGQGYWKANNDRNMKFNAVVGNPPYQVMGGSGGNNDAPIYQIFVDIAVAMKPCYISMIMPSRWFAAGRENLLGEFRNKMLNCGNISKLIVYSDGSDVFKSVEIKGGICYLLIDRNFHGLCEYTISEKGERTTDMISLNRFDVLIRNPKLQKIVEKVDGKIEDHVLGVVSSIISSDTPFGIPSNPRTSSKTPFNVYTSKSSSHDILLYHIENQQRKVEYVSLCDIKKNAQDIDTYKVIVPGAGGSGNDSIVLGNPEYAEIHSVCSQSYLYSPFKTSFEAKAFLKYLKSKFLRVLVSSIKITQSAPNRVYRFVPLQDFTPQSDIDWSKPIPEIDRQLYAKYSLTPEEQSFIERMIKPMD